MTEPPSAPKIGEKPRPNKPWSRPLSGLVLMVWVGTVVWFGDWSFIFTIFLVSLLSLREWVRMVAPDLTGWPVNLVFGALFSVLVVDLFAGAVVGILLLTIAGSVVGIILLFRKRPGALAVAMGLPYIGFAAIALIHLRAVPELGLFLTAFAFIVVVATDIGGMVVGRTVGGPRLAPKLSPNKTWSGLAGAVGFAMLFGGGFAHLLGIGNTLGPTVLAGGLALVAQGGDLLESSVKRRKGLKDSGGLIPGHGGVLDRIDGLIAAAPVLALIHAVSQGEGLWW